MTIIDWLSYTSYTPPSWQALLSLPSTRVPPWLPITPTGSTNLEQTCIHCNFDAAIETYKTYHNITKSSNSSSSARLMISTHMCSRTVNSDTGPPPSIKFRTISYLPIAILPPMTTQERITMCYLSCVLWSRCSLQGINWAYGAGYGVCGYRVRPVHAGVGRHKYLPTHIHYWHVCWWLSTLEWEVHLRLELGELQNFLC